MIFKNLIDSTEWISAEKKRDKTKFRYSSAVLTGRISKSYIPPSIVKRARRVYNRFELNSFRALLSSRHALASLPQAITENNAISARRHAVLPCINRDASIRPRATQLDGRKTNCWKFYRVHQNAAMFSRVIINNSRVTRSNFHGTSSIFLSQVSRQDSIICPDFSHNVK